MIKTGKIWGLLFLAALAVIAVRVGGALDVWEPEVAQADVVGSVAVPRSTGATPTAIPWTRPLFNRAPTGPVPGADEQVAAARATAGNSLRLAGIILVGGQRTALIEAAGTTHRVESGGTVGKWKIARIDPRSVYLESEGAQQVLALDPVKIAR